MAKYNGWTNYETWAVALWLFNDEGAYRYWYERTRALLLTEDRIDTLALAEELKSSHEDIKEEELPSGTVFADLLTTALERVNWEEIARSLIEHLEE